MEDGTTSSNNSAVNTPLNSPSPRPDFTDDGGGGHSGILTDREQVIVSVIVCSSVLVALLAVLVVALVKLAQFIRTSQKFKNFMADASKAEFSRSGNPLYSPNHSPVQLPTHIVKGGSNLDIKIPENSQRHLHRALSQSLGEVIPSRHTGLETQGHGNVSQSPGEVIPSLHTGLETRGHGNVSQSSGEVMPSLHTGLETREHGSRNEVAVHNHSDCPTSQRILSDDDDCLKSDCSSRWEQSINGRRSGIGNQDEQ